MCPRVSWVKTMKRRKKILIVDDEKGITRMLKLNLEATGNYEVREENKGAQTVASAREFKPDLIILDILMPDRSGTEVVVQLKEDQKLKETPIIFLTATVLKEEAIARDGIIAGQSVLAKPVYLPEIINRIERQLAA